jgi:hypothetical protein
LAVKGWSKAEAITVTCFKISSDSCAALLSLQRCIMSTLHDFLVESAKFPFPTPDEDKSAGSTDISYFEVSLLEREWKAGHAIRDDDLVQKLCDAFKTALGDTSLSANVEQKLLDSFEPRIQCDFFLTKHK